MLKKLLSAISLFAFTAIPLSADDQVAMWQVKDDDTVINIMGTVHILKPGTVWINEDITAAIKNADKLYLELSPQESSPVAMQSLIPKYGLLPANENLKDKIGEEDFNKLLKGVEAFGLPAQALDRFQPWFAGVTFASLQYVKLGYDNNAGVEAVLTGLMQADGKPIDGLETAEFQLSIFASLSEEDQIKFLRDALNNEEELETFMAQLTEFWTHGEAGKLGAIINEELVEAPELAEKLLYKRNANWVSDIKRILKEPGNFLIAVGSGHLAGEQSVIDLLKAAGVEVNRTH